MFEKDAEKYRQNLVSKLREKILQGLNCKELSDIEVAFQKGAELGYDTANEWHYIKDGDLPRLDGHTCFSIEVLSDTKKWVYYEFGSGKWYCGNKEVKINAWKEITFPEDCE